MCYNIYSWKFLMDKETIYIFIIYIITILIKETKFVKELKPENVIKEQLQLCNFLYIQSMGIAIYNHIPL